MFNEEEKRQYKSIKAPDDLKSKILLQASQEELNKKTRIPYFKLSIGFMVTIFAFLFYFDYQQGFSILVNQQLISEKETPLETVAPTTHARMMSNPSLQLELEIEGLDTYQVSTKEGTIVLDEQQDNKLIWSIEEPKETTYRLYLDGEDQDYQVLLRYDNKHDLWKIKYQKEKSK